jgi:transcriptional regulator with XRE-family HTH domain
MSAQRFAALLDQYYRSSRFKNQAELAEKLGEYLGNSDTVSDSTISNWRREKNLPQRRPTIIGLIIVLELDTSTQADALLEAADFKPLSSTEIKKMFPKETLEKIVPEVPVAFNNIWYTEREHGVAEIRNPWVGTLELDQVQLTYRGDRFKFLWHGREESPVTFIPYDSIRSVRHMAMPGGLNHNWIAVRYDTNKVVYFADARLLGIGELIGGSHQLFQMIYKIWRELG